MNESPAFQKMKSEGKTSKAPLTESFGQWKNLKVVILALIGLTAGQAVELLDRETQLLAVVAANMLRGVEINQNDLDRIAKAAGRINWLRSQSTGGTYA